MSTQCEASFSHYRLNRFLRDSTHCMIAESGTKESALSLAERAGERSDTAAMRYYTLISNDGDARLIVENHQSIAMDLTSLDPDLTELSDLLLAASLSGMMVDEIADLVLETGDADRFDLGETMDRSRDGRRLLSTRQALRSA